MIGGKIWVSYMLFYITGSGGEGVCGRVMIGHVNLIAWLDRYNDKYNVGFLQITIHLFF